MNKYFAIVNVVVFSCLFLALPLGLNYLQAAILFGIVAALLAPIAIHKVPDIHWVTGLLVGLALFASFPLKKLLPLDGYFQEVLLSMAYGAALWVIGAGWKRSWKYNK